MINVILLPAFHNLINFAAVTEINLRQFRPFSCVSAYLSFQSSASSRDPTRSLPYPMMISRNTFSILSEVPSFFFSLFVFLANPRRQSATHASRGWTGRASRALAKILQLAPRRARRSSRLSDGSRKKVTTQTFVTLAAVEKRGNRSEIKKKIITRENYFPEVRRAMQPRKMQPVRISR